MTADTTVPAEVQAAKTRIDAAIDALLALRGLAAELPDIANQITIGEHGSMNIHIYVGDVRNEDDGIGAAGRIARIAEAAQRHGAATRPLRRTRYGGVMATFGPFELYIYAPLEQVGSSAVREVTEWQLDPRLAAFGTEATPC